jgi:hypothetical protein
VPWELDHRCRGKGKKHIIEVRYDNVDEICEDGAIDAYWSSLMMIVTLAQRLVILASLRRIVTLACWRDSWMDRMIAPVFQ